MARSGFEPRQLASLPSNAALSKRREPRGLHAKGRPKKARTEKRKVSSGLRQKWMPKHKKLKSEKNTGSADCESTTLNAGPVVDRIMAPLKHPSPNP